MKRFEAIIHAWKTDFDFKTFMSAAASTLVSLAFAAGNAVLGIWHQSPWNGSICVYYLMLTGIRSSVILVQSWSHRHPSDQARKSVSRVFRISSIALIAMNLTLFAPISFMVRLEKPMELGLIPILGLTTYTWLRVTIACLNFRTGIRSDNLLTRELRAINLMDALLAIITMQNALVSLRMDIAEGSILVLTAVSSAVLLLVIIAISVRNYILGMRELRQSEQEL